MTTSTEDNLVLNKNTKAASMWSSGGRAYDEVSRGVSEGIRHCVTRLDPKKGEHILDIATGTGLTARYISHSDADAMWRIYEEGFGPIRATLQGLDAGKRADLKAAFIDWLSQFRTDLGIALSYQYLITVGTRK